MREDYLYVLPERIRSSVRGAALEGRELMEEIRIRANRRILLRMRGGAGVETDCIPTCSECERILELICAHSVFAYEEELRAGCVTLSDGSRVGICGRMAGSGILPQAFNIRIAREVHGAGDGLVGMAAGCGIRSLLLISAPGAGKTTMLRDTARQLSQMGYQVGVADERGEISAPVHGVPRLDTGGADVVSGCRKAVAMQLMIRAMAPDVLITDELFSEEDAAAVLNASGCGVKVIASAHAASVPELRRRRSIMGAVINGAFDCAALLHNTKGERTLVDVTEELLCV